MKLISLALKTNLILDRQSSIVEEKKNYIVVTTPQRPNYFWGNYIIMKEPPQIGCFDDWLDIFENEIGTRKERGFVAITFDSKVNTKVNLSDFKKNNFDVQMSKILSTNTIKMPAKYNSDFQIKPFSSEDHWESYVEIHFTPSWGYGCDKQQKLFLQDSAKSFKKVVDQGCAMRYGAFLNGKMIAELGVFWEEGIARFNNVATHRKFQRMGACSTLVYEVSKKILSNKNINILVMEADEDYHAAKIYESIGFVPKQKLVALEWKDKTKFS